MNTCPPSGTWMTTVVYTRPCFAQIRPRAGIAASVRLRIATKKRCLSPSGVKDDCHLVPLRRRGIPFGPRVLIRIRTLAVGHFSGLLHAARRVFRLGVNLCVPIPPVARLCPGVDDNDVFCRTLCPSRYRNRCNICSSHCIVQCYIMYSRVQTRK
jgi:hypothetical protein